MIKNMLRFEGRARRREYWVVSVMNSAIGCFIYAVMFFACTMAGEPLCYRTENMVGFATTGSRIGTVMAIVIVISALYFIISVLALTVRRYHDVGLPGWVFPICLVGCLLFGLGAICHLVITFMPSREDNQYGENPKTPENDEYEGGAVIAVSIIAFILCLALLVCSVIYHVKKCGWRSDVNVSSSGTNPGAENQVQRDGKEPVVDTKRFNHQEFLINDDSYFIVDGNLSFTWYQSRLDFTTNYLKGTCDVYYGSEARSYLTLNLEGYEKSVFHFSEESMENLFEVSKEDPLCVEENLVCLILRHEEVVLDEEMKAQLGYEDGRKMEDVYYFGFYDGETFMCYNILTGTKTQWMRVEVLGDDIPDEDFTEENSTEEYSSEGDFTEGTSETASEEDSGSDASGANGPYHITVGSTPLDITPPAAATDVYAGDYNVSYDCEGIHVEYGDSFCNVTEDSQYLYYTFLVDIGAEDYLEVNVYGSSDDFTKADAFEIADLKLVY